MHKVGGQKISRAPWGAASTEGKGGGEKAYEGSRERDGGVLRRKGKVSEKG